MIVDANFVIQDLIHKVRHPEWATALEEMIRASVIEAYAPRWLETEMISAIPQVARRRKISEEALWAQWQTYRSLLRWDDRFRSPATRATAVPDPKDLPYVDLEASIAADGILSKDPHIKAMGGHLLTVEFVLTARNYARAAVVSVSIRLMGAVVTLLTLKALAATVEAFKRIPPQLTALLILAAVATLLSSTGRELVTDIASGIGDLLAPLWPAAWDIVIAAAALANEAQSEATAALSRATATVRPHHVAPVKARVVKRRRRRSLHGAGVVLQRVSSG